MREAQAIKKALKVIQMLDELADSLPIDSLSRRNVIKSRQDIEELLEQSAGPVVTFAEVLSWQ